MGWTIPRDWEGDTVFILGGGPSLNLVDVDALRGRGRVIAINDAGLIKAPWADMLFFADGGKHSWFGWNRAELHLYTGPLILTRADADSVPDANPWGIKRVGWQRKAAISHDPRFVAGVDSGSNGMNVAALRGAARMVLLAFDMRPGNWHARHKRPGKERNYSERFIPSISTMAEELRRMGVKVVNATPGSALTCFPIMTPEEALAWSTSTS